MFVDDSPLESANGEQIPSLFVVDQFLRHMEMLAQIVDYGIDHAFALLK